jgi:hypothetical protein
MLYKSNKYSLYTQGVKEKTYVKFFKKAYEAVNKGVRKSVVDFTKEPEQFDFRTAKAIWLNSSIKKFFQRAILLDENLRSSINHLKSHGVDYYVLDGKAIICFKKMDIKSRVGGFYSKRFKDLMSGNVIHYSKKMLDNLSEMGIQKALPIYFVGHVMDKHNNLIDVRLVHYDNSSIAYEISIKEMFTQTLFNIIKTDSTNSEVVVTSKRKKASKSAG